MRLSPKRSLVWPSVFLSPCQGAFTVCLPTSHGRECALTLPPDHSFRLRAPLSVSLGLDFPSIHLALRSSQSPSFPLSYIIPCPSLPSSCFPFSVLAGLSPVFIIVTKNTFNEYTLLHSRDLGSLPSQTCSQGEEKHFMGGQQDSISGVGTECAEGL